VPIRHADTCGAHGARLVERLADPVVVPSMEADTMHSKSLLVILVTGALAACGSRSTPAPRSPQSSAVDENLTAAATESPREATAASPPVGEQGPLTDGQIAGVRKAMDESQIQQARLAEERSANSRVRDFAAELVAEHSNAKERQTELLDRFGMISIESRNSTAVEGQGARSLASLRAAKDADFDHAFLDVEVDEQQKMLDTIDHLLIPNAQNEALKAELLDLVSRVSSKVKEAFDIRRSLASTPAASDQ
jgi:putative membrane protein